MTDFKRRTLFLSSGKQIKLYGNSMSITASLEIGEGGAPNIFSFFEQQSEEKSQAENELSSQEIKMVKEKVTKTPTAVVQNPHRLTIPELLELADYNIQLWMNLKDNIRKHGITNPKIFNRESS